MVHLKAEIVETTFRSRFRFRFLKYPLFKKVVSFRFSVILKYPLLKKVVSFRVPEIKKLFLFVSGKKSQKILVSYAQIK